MIKVINDYLQPDELKAIQDLMYEHKFWSYDPFKVLYNDIEEDDLRDGQFNHGFFNSATLPFFKNKYSTDICKILYLHYFV